MDYYGKSLLSYFRKQGGKLQAKKVIEIGVSMIENIEKLH